MSEENPNTPPATPPTPEWKAIAPNFNSEVELANSYRSATGELTRAKQELAALKSQPKSEESPGWDWQDPNKIWDSTGEQFNPEWVKYVGDRTQAPEPVLKELLDTVVKARGIIKESSKTKWDTVAGFENSQQQVLEYLGKTYQGQALQERSLTSNTPGTGRTLSRTHCKKCKFQTEARATSPAHCRMSSPTLAVLCPSILSRGRPPPCSATPSTAPTPTSRRLSRTASGPSARPNDKDTTSGCSYLHRNRIA
jgi:hypothetical protein